MGRPVHPRRPLKHELSQNPFICAVTFLCSLFSALPQPHPKDKRPHVDVDFQGIKLKALVDTGAGMSVVTEQVVMRMPGRHNLQKVPIDPKLRLSSVSGQNLQIVARYSFTIKMLDRTIVRPFYVVRGLEMHTVILGIDFICEQQLVIDSNDVFFKKVAELDDKLNLTLRPQQDTLLEARSVQPVAVIPTYYNNCRVAPGTLTSSFTAGSNVGLWDSLNEVQTDGSVICVLTNLTNSPMYISSQEVVGFGQVLTEDQIQPVNDEYVASLFGGVADDPPEPSNEAKPISDEERDFILANIKIEATSAWLQAYRDLILRFHDTCSKSKFDLGRTGVVKHAIRLKDNEPVHEKQFRIPLEHVKVIHDWLEELIAKGAIEISRSAYNSPIFLVPKPHGHGLRVVLDYRKLNLASVPDRYTIREVRDCVDEVGQAGSMVFSALDLTSGFWQQELEEESRQYTAFTVPGRGTRYQWTVTPMGLQGSPSSFARLIDYVMRGLRFVICYIDDVLVHSPDHEQHLQHLEKVLMRLRKYNLKLNVSKSIFGAKEVTYLGYTLSGEGVGPGPEKLKAIREFPVPTNIKKIREALGLCNYFRFLIPNYQKYSSHLSKLLQKDAGYKEGPMPQESQDAFIKLRDYLGKAPIVQHPRPGLPYILRTDAAAGDAQNPGGFGAVLSQLWKDGQERVISYASRSLEPYEKNYTAYLLEMAAAAWAIDYFHVYLAGRKFELYTDHRPLETLSTVHKKTLNRLQQQLLQYDFTIHYVKGENNSVADALSRNVAAILPREYSHPCLKKEVNRKLLISALSDSSGSLKTAQNKDTFINEVRRFLENDPSLNLTDQQEAKVSRIARDCVLKDGIVFFNLHRKNLPAKLCVLAPDSLKTTILKDAHTTWDGGHGGELRTLNRVTRSFWWPGITNDIDKFIHGCIRCQAAKGKKPAPAPLKNLPICEAPNERIHIDLFGELKRTSPEGNKYIMVMTDAFTKYAELVAIPDKKADTIAKAFFERWICRFSVPQTIVTDNGREFANKVVDELCDLLHVEHRTTSPYHPQANSSAESYNRQIIKYMKTVMNDASDTLDWEEFLPPLMFSYNTHIHQATQQSPFFLTFHHDPRLPYFDLDNPRPLYGEDYVTHAWKIAQHTQREALRHLKQQAVRQKHYHDLKAKRRNFQVNEEVLVHFPNPPVKANAKFHRFWQGPFKIIKKIGNLNFLVQLKPRARKFLVHVDRLKKISEPFDPSSSSDTSSQPSQPSQPTTPQQSHDSSWADQVADEEELQDKFQMTENNFWESSGDTIDDSAQNDHAANSEAPRSDHAQNIHQEAEEPVPGPSRPDTSVPAAPPRRLTRARAAAEGVSVPDLWPNQSKW